jgi:AsmA family protein
MPLPKPPLSAGASAARRARRWKITAWSLAATAVVAAASAIIAEASGWPFLRGPLQRALERAAGVPVAFGEPQDRFVLKLLGQPRLDVAAMTIGAAAGPAAPHLLSGQDLRLGWRWSDVWQGWRGSAPWRVDSLQARTLDVHLLRDAQGRATWQIGKTARAAGNDSGAELPRIGRLIVGSGRIVVDDQPLATQLLVTLRGGEGEAAVAVAGWRAKVEGQWRALPLQLNVATGSAMPLVADVAEADIDLRIDGQVGAARVAFDGRAGALLGARRLEGALKFGGPSLDRVGKPLGVTLPQTPPFELEGQIAHDAGLWQLTARRASIGKSRLAGQFQFDTRRATPLLSGLLTGTRLVFADLGPSIGANSGSAKQPTGRVLPQRRFDLPSLQAMDADVQVTIDELDFGTEAMAPLRGVSTQLVLAGGRLELQQMKALLAGGHVSGTSSYDSRSAPAGWAARLRLAGVDIAGWLHGAQPVRNVVTGALDAALDLRGSGNSSADILATLNGNIDLTLRDGTLSHVATEAAGLDLAQALGVIVRGDRPLPLRCARLQATARNGVLRTDRGVIDNSDTTLRLAGELNLKDESLALVASARPKDFSPLSLRTPITVRGTLARPVIGIDGGKLAGKVGAVAALGAALGPLAALMPLLDFGSKNEGDACAALAPTVPTAPTSAPR